MSDRLSLRDVCTELSEHAVGLGVALAVKVPQPRGGSGALRPPFSPRRCYHTTFSEISQSPRKCRQNYADEIPAVFSGFLLISHFFIHGHDIGGTCLSQYKTHVSARKIFFQKHGSFPHFRTFILARCEKHEESSVSSGFIPFRQQKSTRAGLHRC